MDRMVRTNGSEDQLNEHRYASTEEALAAFDATLPRFDRAYREAARGVGAPPLDDADLDIAETTV